MAKLKIGLKKGMNLKGIFNKQKKNTKKSNYHRKCGETE